MYFSHFFLPSMLYTVTIITIWNIVYSEIYIIYYKKRTYNFTHVFHTFKKTLIIVTSIVSYFCSQSKISVFVRGWKYLSTI